MSTDRRQQRSVWLSDAPQTDFSPLDGSAAADVAVIGGGITGLTTALLLQRSGLRVVLLEADHLGCGVTGGSTAKVTSLHNAIYAPLERKFDRAAARTYGEANEAGLARVAALAEEARHIGVDCRFERRVAVTYTRDEDRVGEIREEAEAAARAGLPASFTTETDLPFDVAGAVRVENQAQFDPYRYCLGLSRLFVDWGGTIHESSRVHDVVPERGEDLCRVRTADGEVSARHVVVATLLPFLDRGGFFARTSPSRSYGIAASLDEPPPTDMSITIDSPTRSVRPLPDGRGIIVVGEQHKVGQDPDTRQRYDALESWAREWFAVRSIDARWSAQDYMSADSVPYVGKMPLGAGRVWTATGFNKWGLTSGTAAALILTDLIHGRDNPWAALFDATRTDVLLSAKKVISENLNVGKRFVGDRLRSLNAGELNQLAPGQGGIVDHDGEKLAAFRDEAGAIHACSPVCTHMGCYVQWNTAEKSWDCPCHGSRFGHDGEILQGPAVAPLERKPL